MTLENESEKKVEVEKTDTKTIDEAKSLAITMGEIVAAELKKAHDEQKKVEEKIVSDKAIVANEIKVIGKTVKCGEFENEDEMKTFAAKFVPMNLLMQSNNIPAFNELQKALTTYGNIGTDADGGSFDPVDAHGILARSVESFPSHIEDTKQVPTINSVATFIDNTSDTTTHMITEGNAGTESKAGFTTRTITLKKALTLAPVTGELIRFGSLANITSEVFTSMGRAISKKLQHLVFISDGDSDSVDGGITGLIDTIENVADNSSIYNVGGGGWDNLSEADVSRIIALPSGYADTNKYAWYTNKANWAELERLSRAGGGNSYLISVLQRPIPMLHSFPVKFTNQMPASYADGEIGLLFGDLSAAVATADLGQTFIDSSKEFYFDQDAVVLRAIKHIGVNVFQPGANGTPGPMIAVRYQAS